MAKDATSAVSAANTRPLSIGEQLGDSRPGARTYDFSNAPHRPRPRPAQHKLVMLHVLGRFGTDAPMVFETYEASVQLLWVESCGDSSGWKAAATARQR